jgi:outer membrane immunogenic protein
MRHITRLSIAATAAMAASLSAQAADLRPPAAKEPVYTWAGFYAGVNAGYGWSRTEVDLSGTPLFCPGPVVLLCAAQVASIPPSLGTNARGAVLGGQAGFNYQIDRIVAGVEADLDWTNMQASAGGLGQAPVVGLPGNFITTTTTADQRLRYFGTLRARVGFTPVNLPYLLAYVTGGLAFGGLNSSTTLGQTPAAVCLGCIVSPAVGSESAIRTGWTVGGGLEYLLGGNWTAKAEYLYFNLGSTSYSLSSVSTVVVPLPPGAPFLFSNVGVTSTTGDFRGNLIRVGLNYKFAY